MAFSSVLSCFGLSQALRWISRQGWAEKLAWATIFVAIHHMPKNYALHAGDASLFVGILSMCITEFKL